MENKLSEKAKEARNAYYRQYRSQNRDRIKSINQRYWEKKADEIKRREAENAD